MTKTAKPQSLSRGKTYARDLERGNSLQCEVSPCVFMYAGYPLQIRLTLHAGNSQGTAYAVDRGLTAKTAAESDVLQLFASVRLLPCRRCSTPAFDPATVETNRAGLCEGCFLADFKIEIAKEAEMELQRIAQRDRLMKANGERFRLTAWIHPQAGDDFQLDWYFPTRPARARVRSLLRNEGSIVLDDFEIITL